MNTIFKIKKKTFVNGSLLSCKSCKSYNPAPASIFRMKYTLFSCSSCKSCESCFDLQDLREIRVQFVRADIYLL